MPDSPLNLTAARSLQALRNFVPISERVVTSGQPAPEQFSVIRAAGVETVISLLPVERELTEEPAIVEALGMEYVNIPVLWHHPTRENLRDFFAAMDARSEQILLVHCAVNMRVSAFMFLYRVLRQGIPIEEAELELHDIWVPEGIWAEFIEDALQNPQNL
ncbi:MAG: hypothetical protein OHK0029_35700 [Armatimonadaceae bacterium]